MGLVAFVGLCSAGAAIARADTDLTTKLDPTAPAASTTTLTPSPIASTTTSAAPIAASAPPAARDPRHAPRHRASDEPAAESAPSAAADEASSAAPSPSMSAAPPDTAPLVSKSVPIGVDDLTIALKVPSDWPELSDDALPSLDDASSADVTIVARKGFGVHRPKDAPPIVREVVVVCGKARGELWADAIRDAAFTAMTAGVEKVVGAYASIGSIEPEAIATRDRRLQETFAAEGPFSTDARADVEKAGSKKKSKPEGTVRVRGLSTLGFANDGKGRVIVACSIACAELVASGEKGVCGEVAKSIDEKGTWLEPPERSRVAELLFALRANPTVAWLVGIGSVFLLLALVIVGVVFARRRRARGATNANVAIDPSTEEATDEAMDDDADDEGRDAPPSARAAAPRIETLVASPPPAQGYFDPKTFTRR